MGLKSRLTAEIGVNAPGNFFHRLFRHEPHQVPNLTPSNVHDVKLIQGDWGTVGSIVQWNYTHDGKKEVGKTVIEAADDKKVIFKVTEGDLMKSYKQLRIALQFDVAGEGQERPDMLYVQGLEEDSKQVMFGGVTAAMNVGMKVLATTQTAANLALGEHLIIWIIEYEKVSEDIPELTTLLQVCCDLTKDIEVQHSKGIESLGTFHHGG